MKETNKSELMKWKGRKMQILQFTQSLLKSTGALTVFSESFLGKFMEIIKFGLIMFPPASIIISVTWVAILHKNDVKFMIANTFFIVGCAISLLLNCSFFFQSKKVANLLGNIEALVNESKC